MAMPGPRCLLFALAWVLGWSTPARADPLAYVRASSQHGVERDRAEYHPMNLLDDDPGTIWCEGHPGDGEGQSIRIIFKKPQKIDRLIVGPTTQTGRRVTRVSFTDGTSTMQVPLADSYVEQRFQTAMRGTEYVLEIVEVGAPNKASKLDASVACLADVILYFKKRPFGGRTPPEKLRYDANRDRILGVWNGGALGAPEKYLTFALDGTWTWRFEPLMGGKPRKMKGEYRFRGKRLLMRKGETGRWGDVRFKHERVKVDPRDAGAPAGDYDQITFNDLLGDDFAGSYNDAQF